MLFAIRYRRYHGKICCCHGDHQHTCSSFPWGGWQKPSARSKENRKWRQGKSTEAAAFCRPVSPAPGTDGWIPRCSRRIWPDDTAYSSYFVQSRLWEFSQALNDLLNRYVEIEFSWHSREKKKKKGNPCSHTLHSPVGAWYDGKPTLRRKSDLYSARALLSSSMYAKSPARNKDWLAHVR